MSGLQESLHSRDHNDQYLEAYDPFQGLISHDNVRNLDVLPGEVYQHLLVL